MIVAELDALDAARVIVAAETGMRPEEWIALERRDLDRTGRALAGAAEVREGRHAPLREEPPGASPGAADREGVRTRSTQLPPRLDTTLLFPAPEGGHLRAGELADTELVPGIGGGGDLEARPVPPAPHLRDRGVRGWGVDLRVVAGDGHLARR